MFAGVSDAVAGGATADWAEQAAGTEALQAPGAAAPLQGGVSAEQAALNAGIVLEPTADSISDALSLQQLTAAFESKSDNAKQAIRRVIAACFADPVRVAEHAQATQPGCRISQRRSGLNASPMVMVKGRGAHIHVVSPAQAFRVLEERCPWTPRGLYLLANQAALDWLREKNADPTTREADLEIDKWLQREAKGGTALLGSTNFMHSARSKLAASKKLLKAVVAAHWKEQRPDGTDADEATEWLQWTEFPVPEHGNYNDITYPVYLPFSPTQPAPAATGTDARLDEVQELHGKVERVSAQQLYDCLVPYGAKGWQCGVAAFALTEAGMKLYARLGKGKLLDHWFWARFAVRHPELVNQAKEESLLQHLLGPVAVGWGGSGENLTIRAAATLDKLLKALIDEPIIDTLFVVDCVESVMDALGKNLLGPHIPLSLHTPLRMFALMKSYRGSRDKAQLAARMPQDPPATIQWHLRVFGLDTAARWAEEGLEIGSLDTLQAVYYCLWMKFNQALEEQRITEVRAKREGKGRVGAFIKWELAYSELAEQAEALIQQ